LFRDKKVVSVFVRFRAAGRKSIFHQIGSGMARINHVF
jgi:hypothetical protein